jgi:hypothetical protein
VQSAVIDRAVRWLMSLLDVTGIMPVINTLIAVYNAIESFIQYLRQMLEIVSKVLDGVIDIAHGSLDSAAGFLEAALGDAMPVAIGFLANQFGLGRIGERMHELLETVRATVDRGIDWLLDRAIAGGQALIAMAKRGVAAIKGWWQQRVPFEADGEHHELYFTGEGSSAQLTVASDPKSFSAFLDEEEVGAKGDKAKNISKARGLYKELLDLERTAGSGSADPKAATPAKDDSARVLEITNELATLARDIMGGGAGASTAPEYGGLKGGMGSSASVERLTAKHPPGDQPSVSGGLWTTLSQRRNGKSPYYIMGHLLNHNLGGPGNSWANLTPLTGSFNTTMSNRFEEHVKKRVHDDKVPVKFKVTASYGRDARAAEQKRLRGAGNPDDALVADIIQAEQFVPLKISCEANDVSPSAKGTPVSPWSEDNDIDVARGAYSLDGAPKLPAHLSDMTAADMVSMLGVSPALAKKIESNAPYRTRDELKSKTGANWDNLVATTSFRLRLYKID